MEKLFAGAARVCIDPPDEAYPFPTNFCLCQEKYDACHVRAVTISNSQRTILFVVYELSDIPGVPGLESALAQAAGIPRGDVILAVTHNHSSPCDRCKVGDFPEKFELMRKIELEAGVEAVKKAMATMRPARYGYGTIESICNVNRDLKTAFGFWVEGPNYAGYSDHNLYVLKLEDLEGKLIAAILNFGAHAVCAFAQKDVDGKVKTSGNFPGIACRFVEEHYGGDAVALWTSGAAGNQDPLLFEYQWYEYPDGYISKIFLPDGTGYFNMEALGRRQGADAVACLDGIQAVGDEMAIQYLKSTVSFPARRKKANGSKSAPFGFRMGSEGPRTDFSPPVMPAMPELEPDPGKTVDYVLNVLRLGHVAIVLTSGELYAEIARDMLAASPVKDAFLITHIPGGGGYTLDKGSVDHKTFQAFGAIEPGITDDVLAEKTKELVTEAFAR